jgi:hypothetical protein
VAKPSVTEEQPMDESTSPDGNWVAIVSGAVFGSLAFYLLLTPRGRQLCDSFVRVLDECSTECRRLSYTVSRAQLAAATAWHALDDVSPGEV